MRPSRPSTVTLTLVVEYDGNIDTITDALNEALHQIAYDEGRHETSDTGGYVGFDWAYLPPSDDVHHCTEDCYCFTECLQCGEPFCIIESQDTTLTCISHSGGDWDLRKHLNRHKEDRNT